MSSHALEGLEPALLWDYFSQLSRIPRESKKERAAGDFVVKVAKDLGLEHARDKAGNVVVRKPASAGFEGRPSVCLQSHLDMVCVKRNDKKHDFARDPITLLHEDGWVKADGTTLGADNGIAVATNLAIMADRSLEHGPLELGEPRALPPARQVVDELPLAQSTVSQHLKVLKEAGLVRGDVDGPRVCYCIEPRALRRLRALVGGL